MLLCFVCVKPYYLNAVCVSNIFVAIFAMFIIFMSYDPNMLLCLCTVSVASCSGLSSYGFVSYSDQPKRQLPNGDATRWFKYDRDKL